MAGFVFAASHASEGETIITVNNAKPHQIMEGFGATHFALAQDRPRYPKGDTLAPELRAKVLNAVYGQVKLTMGNIDARGFETRAGHTEPGNDYRPKGSRMSSSSLPTRKRSITVDAWRRLFWPMLGFGNTLPQSDTTATPTGLPMPA